MPDERPKHVHLCERPSEWNEEDVEDWEVHQWECSSPYCNTKLRVCPKHGGERPRLHQ